MAKLTDKQELFCREYLIDLNATQAAIRAGYSKKTAREIAAQNLAKLNIQKQIQELMSERNERNKIDADYVLRQAVKLHERCMQEIDPLTDRNGEEIKDDNGKAIYKFNARDAATALKLIGEHVNVQAFKQQIINEHVGVNGGAIITSNMSAEEAEEYYKKMMS